jgi:hypothetical protein
MMVVLFLVAQQMEEGPEKAEKTAAPTPDMPHEDAIAAAPLAVAALEQAPVAEVC